MAKDFKGVGRNVREPFLRSVLGPPVSLFNRDADMNAIQIAAGGDGDVELLQFLLNPFIASTYRVNTDHFTLPPPIFLLRAWNSGLRTCTKWARRFSASAEDESLPSTTKI